MRVDNGIINFFLDKTEKVTTKSKKKKKKNTEKENKTSENKTQAPNKDSQNNEDDVKSTESSSNVSVRKSHKATGDFIFYFALSEQIYINLICDLTL